MFEANRAAAALITFKGRLDASQVDRARIVLDSLTESCTIDFNELDYISSAGLGILLATQKRLSDSGHGLTISGMNRHIREIFHIAGFEIVFTIV